MLGQVPTVAELVDAGRPHEEAPELGAHHVDRGLHLPGCGLGGQARLRLRGLVVLEQAEI